MLGDVGLILLSIFFGSNQIKSISPLFPLRAKKQEDPHLILSNFHIIPQEPNAKKPFLRPLPKKSNTGQGC